MTQNRQKAIWIGLILLLILMFVTKPSRRDFKDYINHSIEDHSENVLEEMLTKIGSKIASTTETRDYVFFTINEYSVLGEDTLRFVGVFGYFVLIGKG